MSICRIDFFLSLWTSGFALMHALHLEYISTELPSERDLPLVLQYRNASNKRLGAYLIF